MITLKESEIKKFKEHEIEKYLKEVETICNEDPGNENTINTDKFGKLIDDIFSAGFDSGIKTASTLLKAAVKTMCGTEEG